ncbi:hypothetical protein [Limnohabitans sp. MMS-10A-178]|uniref:hypothetical protein n=1 Tax=Limnohabitans sp. MMS-10A-178 TaxID=1835767 RepID=UPI0011B24FA5|nr:hypothetical protein [Limnohabitans sp. MMS-10A-178]
MEKVAIKGALIGLLLLSVVSSTYASSLTGLQECQAIKNAAKKADCFDRQTKKMMQEENDRKQKEEVARIEAEKIAAEEKKLASERKEKEALAKIEAEKIAAEEKRIASERKKIEKAQKILQVVRRVQTRVGTGVSYRDYSGVISDPKFEVQSYLRESSDEMPEFSKSLSTAMDFYDVAGTIWAFQFEGPSVSRVTCEPSQERFISSVLKGVFIPKDSDVNRYCMGFVINAAVRASWTKASESIEASDRAIKKKNQEINRDQMK